MMNYAIAGGTFMGSAQHSQLSNIVENVKKAIKKIIDVLNQRGEPGKDYGDHTIHSLVNMKFQVMAWLDRQSELLYLGKTRKELLEKELGLSIMIRMGTKE